MEELSRTNEELKNQLTNSWRAVAKVADTAIETSKWCQFDDLRTNEK